MRILLLSQGRKIEDQISFHNAFKNSTVDGSPVELRNIPFIGFIEQFGLPAFYDEVLRVNREFAPDVVLFQACHWRPLKDPSSCILALRNAANHPLIFGTCGDLFQPYYGHMWVRKPLKPMTIIATMADAFFMTQMGRLAEYLVSKGAKNIVHLPNVLLDSQFPGWDTQLPDERDFDVVMLGSARKFSVRDPFSSYFHYRRRLETVNALWKRYGKRFGLFGPGWNHPAAQGAVPFGDQIRVFQRSRIVVDSRPPYPEMYYASNRSHQIAGSGAALVQYYTPRFDKMFRPGNNADFVYDQSQLISTCDNLLMKDPAALAVRAAETRQLMRERHLRIHRCDTILSVAQAIRAIRSGRVSLAEGKNIVRLHQFLPDVDLTAEKEFAMSNWLG